MFQTDIHLSEVCNSWYTDHILSLLILSVKGCGKGQKFVQVKNEYAIFFSNSLTSSGWLGTCIHLQMQLQSHFHYWVDDWFQCKSLDV